MVHEARASVAIAVNSGLTMLYWRIGKRINADVLKGERAKCGSKTLVIMTDSVKTCVNRIPKRSNSTDLCTKPIKG
jgi:hypothetical protein